MSQNASPQRAILEWDETGQPVSVLFDDVYFSRANGLEETRHVFLAHNQLPERFCSLNAGQKFTIAETGFGSGLNFLAAWALFDQKASPGTSLHFISVEKFPLGRDDLKKALNLWPELRRYAKSLLAVYMKDPLSGFHHVVFDSGRVSLTLIFDDVTNALPQISGTVDAWFLDGFAPARNPDMWSPVLFKAMAECSDKHTTYATFTAAGIVRKGLVQAGFTAERVKGFGRKRHMVCGCYTGHKKDTGHHDNNRLMSFILQQDQGKKRKRSKEKIWLNRNHQLFSQRHAIIIGAGLAGCCTAYALVQRGWQVTVVDQANVPAAGASGNLQGALYMRLSGADTILSRLLIQGYGYSVHLLNALFDKKQETVWSPSGLVQTGFDEQEIARQEKITGRGLPMSFVRPVLSEELSELSGIPLNLSGLWFEKSGWVHPPAFCQALLNQPGISFTGNHEVLSLLYEDNCWTVNFNAQSSITAPVVVIANSYSATLLEQTRHLVLKKIRGQVSYIPATDKSSAQLSVLCGNSYVAPPVHGIHTIGATHQFNDNDSAVRTSDHKENLVNLEKDFPAVYEAVDGHALSPGTLQGRTGFRCSTPDYLPLLGPVVDASLFRQQFAYLVHDAKYSFTDSPVYLPGLYVNVGHGSRGLITCPLSGEVLAGLINNEVLPVPEAMAQALHPGRLLAREMIRGNASQNKQS